MASSKADFLHVFTFGLDGNILEKRDLGVGHNINLSPDGRWLLATPTKPPLLPTLDERDAPQERVLRDLETKTSQQWSQSTAWEKFSGDGKTLFTTNPKGELTIRNLATAYPLTMSNALPAFAAGEWDDWAVSSDGQRLASLDSASTLARCWDIHKPFTPFTYPLVTTIQVDHNSALRWSAEDTLQAVYVQGITSGDRYTQFRTIRWQASTAITGQENEGQLSGAPLVIQDSYFRPNLACFSSNGWFMVVYWSKPQVLDVVNASTRDLLASCKLVPASQLQSLIFAPDNQTFLTADQNGEITIRTLQGNIVRKWDAATEHLEAVTLSPDGTRLAVQADGSLTLWDTASGQKIKSFATDLEVNTESVAIAWSPDGKMLAWGWMTSKDEPPSRHLQLFDVQNERVVREWPLENHAVALRFSPDSKVLGVNIGRRYLQLWNIADGTAVTPPNDDCDVFDFEWSPDGKYLAINTGGLLKIWRWSPHHK